jgi:RNA polymerase sigma-70 factor (ECF subfamily)
LSVEQIIYDCKNNDRKAQEQLYKLLSPKLFAVCLKYSRNYAEAEDNLQDGFILLFKKIEQYQFRGSFEGWAKRLMINNILQKYRNQGVYELVNDNIIDNNPTVILTMKMYPSIISSALSRNYRIGTDWCSTCM